MSTDPWLEANNRYLAASLRWLRLRLQRLSPERKPASAGPSMAVLAEPRRPVWGLIGWGAQRGGAEPLLALPPQDPADAILDAAEERTAAAAIDPPPALVLLAGRLGLTDFERDTLLLCAAVELDPGIAELLATAPGAVAPAQTSRALGFPTFVVALQAFDEPSWDAQSPYRPLRHARLLEVNQTGATPLTASPLRADERIVNYIKGLNAVDERVGSLATPVAEPGPPQLSASQSEVAETVLKRLRSTAGEAAVPAIQLLGTDPVSKLAVARQVGVALNRRLHQIGLDTLPSAKAELEEFARLWRREAVLLPLALYIDAENFDQVPAETAAALQRLLGRNLGLLFVARRDLPEGGRALAYAVEVDRPTVMEQCEAWLAALSPALSGDTAARTAGLLAGQFDLNLPDIAHAARLAQDDGEPDDAFGDRVWDSCRALTRPRLEGLAERLESKADWDDLVVGDEAAGLLRRIAGQVRDRYTVHEAWGYARQMSRGLGISALFAGESGTGKTMAAEVIANELRLDLLRIDLSAVVSKYIGETEKNLRRLFDGAERGGAILLFDEADALFGKRSEVKDSHDRYANIEINYLLQRMEAFSGLAILATNMKTALDNAFMRRLRFVVTFAFPGLPERKRIWQRALPPDVPKDEIDYDRLARFSLSGGNIQSIAVNAAFLAARAGDKVTMPMLLAATRTELRKLEKPINEAEFR
jgi:hypothetical protein